MSYSRIKLTEIILSAVFIVAFAIEMNLPDSMSFHTFLILAIGTGVLFLVPTFYLDHLESKQYPQWKGIWKIPRAVTVLIAIIIVIMVVAAFLTDYSLSWMIILLLLQRPCSDYYYARKYDLDNLGSVEELLRIHPETKDRMRRNVFGG